MNILKGIAAVLLGLVIGSAVNMGLIISGSSIIPAPDGVDVADMESIAAGMHLFEPKHFVFPFLAHALGTSIGAIVAGVIAPTKRLIFGLGIGGFFLIGGVVNAFMIPAPAWFIGLDLLAAYIPMGWLGGLLALKMRPEVANTDGAD